MSLTFTRLGSLLLAAVLVTHAVGCGETSEADVASEDQTSAKLTAGTYVLDGEPAHWVIKQLVLREDGTVAVQMYPGAAFPMDAVKTTTGTYVQTADKLTINFAKGNEFNAWTVSKKSGAKVQLTDTLLGNGFTLKRASSSTTFDPGPAQGSDPGKPRQNAGQARLTCHSDVGDVWFNVSIKADGTGTMYLSSATSLELAEVEKVKLVNEYPDDEPSDWVHAAGNGNDASNRRYLLDIPTDLIENGGKAQHVGLQIGSSEYESDPYVSWGTTCDSTGTK